MAVFGSLFLSPAVKAGAAARVVAGSAAGAAAALTGGAQAGMPSSPHAIAVASGGLAASFGLALLASLPLARVIAASRRRPA